MSMHFSANQYEESYKPWRLGAWEVSRSFPHRPRVRKGRTKIIANDRGHLLKATSNRNPTEPWGPLTQQIDINQIHDENVEVKNLHSDEVDKSEVKPISEKVLKNYSSQSKKNIQEDKENIDKFLKITGESVATATPRSSAHEEDKESVVSSAIEKVSKFDASIKSSATNSSQPSSRNSSKISSHSVTLKKSRKISDSEKVIEEASKLPPDTIEDALLPRKTEDVLDFASRALAIRLVEHPGATNCTKYTVLRPYTAPSPTQETPLLAKRPKTSQPITKISEIEYALKWDLRDGANENDIIIDVKELDTRYKRGSAKEPQTPRSIASVNSDDSGVHISKCAWEETGPDKNELTLKLESLRNSQEKEHPNCRKDYEIESGYGTPSSVKSKSSLPKVKSEASLDSPRSKMSNTPSKKLVNSALSYSSKNSNKISIDSEAHSGKLSHTQNKEQCKIPSPSINNERSSSTNPKNEAQVKKPPDRDPLEIMETIDSVFHKVPLRDTGRGITSYRSVREEKDKLKTTATQTELKLNVEEQTPNLTVKKDIQKKLDLHNQLRARNCVACEVKALDDPPKKYAGDYRPPFRFGKPEKKCSSKPRYLKQSDRYQARLKTHLEVPRYWAINTLSSPFNNRLGYGQDQYPNNMRLQTTYELAHPRHSKPQHTPLIKKLYK